MTKKHVSKNTKLSYKRIKRNTHSNTLKHTRRNTRLKQYNIKTQNAGGNWLRNLFKKNKNSPETVLPGPGPGTETTPPTKAISAWGASGSASSTSVLSDDSGSTSTTNNSLELTHVWYRNWPDHGVPTMNEFKTFIYTLHKNFNNKDFDFVNLKDDDSIIIHCSAGVGRSGVVLIILQLLYEYKYTGIINDKNNGIDAKTILDAIKTAREHRMMLVQTFEQFKFICNFFNIKPSEDYIVTFNNLATISGIIKTAYENKPLNRYVNILPYDGKIVTLKNDKYVNASTMEALKIDGKTIKIILTQGPIQNTVQDFLQMCFEKKVRLIIMLTGLVERKDGKLTDKCADYMIGIGGLKTLLEDKKKHVLYTKYKIVQSQQQDQDKDKSKYNPEFVDSISVPDLIEGDVPNNTEQNSDIFNNPRLLMNAVSLRQNNLGNNASKWKKTQNMSQINLGKKIRLDVNLGKHKQIILDVNLGKKIRLDLIAYLGKNPKFFNIFIDELYTKMSLTNDAINTLQAEFIRYGRRHLRTMLVKNNTENNTKSNIDINSRAILIEYLTLQIDSKTQNTIKENIIKFNNFINTFNDNLLTEIKILKTALIKNGSAKLIRMLTLIDEDLISIA